MKGIADHSSGHAEGERALHEDERFRSLADTAPAMLWVAQPDGACSFFSRDWYEFTGQTEGGALGSGWLDAVHPADRERSDAAFAAANAKRGAFAVEYRLRRRDGRYRWVLDSGRARYDGERFLGYVGSVIDITERKRSELLDQEQKRVLALIAAGKPLEECLRAIAEAVTQLAPTTLACGVIVAPDSRRSVGELSVCFPHALGEALCEAQPADSCHSAPVLGPGGRGVATVRLWLPVARPPSDWEVRSADFAAHATGVALERERAAAALQDSDTRFRIAADAAGAVVYDVDVSPRGEGSAEVHGLEHIIGSLAHERLTIAWWRSRIHPDDHAAHEATVLASLKDSTS